LKHNFRHWDVDQQYPPVCLTYTALSEVNLVLSAQHGLCLACGPRKDANAPQSANAEMPYLSGRVRASWVTTARGVLCRGIFIMRGIWHHALGNQPRGRDHDMTPSTSDHWITSLSILAFVRVALMLLYQWPCPDEQSSGCGHWDHPGDRGVSPPTVGWIRSYPLGGA
jgi:hypothetical protein